MANQSRVKRYEDLRNSIESQSNDQEVVNGAFQEFHSASKKIDAYEPVHQRETNETSHLVEPTGEFKNEYLDSFIQEVRDYNMQKGVRENDDTRLDILQQLSTKQREKRASYMESVVEPNVEETTPNYTAVESEPVFAQPVVDSVNEMERKEDAIATTQEIARQVQELLMQETLAPVEDVKSFQEPVVEEATIVEEESDDTDTDSLAISVQDNISREELFEETLKLKTQLNEYEEELGYLNDGVDKNNRLLNIIIAVLIIVLLGVVGVVAYWMISGGLF